MGGRAAEQWDGLVVGLVGRFARPRETRRPRSLFGIRGLEVALAVGQPCHGSRGSGCFTRLVATASLRRNASRADVAAEYAIRAATPCRPKEAAEAVGRPVDHERASKDADTTGLGPDGGMTAGSCMMYSTSITSC